MQTFLRKHGGWMLVVVGLAGSGLWYLSSPKPTITHHHTRVLEMVHRIPPEVSVSAQESLMPHIRKRVALTQFPEQWSEAQYVALDTKSAPFPLGEQEYRFELSHLKLHQHYDLIYQDDGVLLFKRQSRESSTP